VEHKLAKGLSTVLPKETFRARRLAGLPDIRVVKPSSNLSSVDPRDFINVEVPTGHPILSHPALYFINVEVPTGIR